MQNGSCAIWKKAVRVGILALVLTSALTGWSSAAEAEKTEVVSEAVSQMQMDRKYAFFAAAGAFGVAALAAGYAIANVGSAAMGAIAEKPEIAGQAIVFIALAEGLVVFGFITALMILGKI